MLKIGMTKKLIISSLLLLSFISCNGKAETAKNSVSGKIYSSDEFELSVLFDGKSDNALFMGIVGKYTQNKNEVTINNKVSSIKFTLKDNVLTYIYIDSEDGSEIPMTFEEKGVTDFFTNVYENQSKQLSGATFNFTNDTVELNEKKINYKFDTEFFDYSIGNYKPTRNRKEFNTNVYYTFLADSIKSVTNEDLRFSEYENAWWLKQKSEGEITDDMLEAYTISYYEEEYDNTEDNPFALRKLYESKRNELQKKLAEVNANEKFIMRSAVTLGQYNFNKEIFTVENGVASYMEMDSTLAGDDYKISPSLYSYNKTKYGTARRQMYPHNTSVYLKIKTSEAEALEAKLPEDRSCIEIFIVKPNLPETSREMNWYNREIYKVQYDLVSASLYDAKTFEYLGELTVETNEW